MAFDYSRPSTQNGGSRPPTSRFVEGSMNDRVSAAPPAQFLGPKELKEFERQFYAEPTIFQREARKTRRPFSESNLSPRAKVEEHVITHRKSTGFFGRVRDALGWSSSSSSSSSSSRSSGGSHKMEQVRKHKSLQEPIQRQPPPELRPDHLRAAKSHSEMYNIPHLPNLGNGNTRPSREDVLESYNQLMASGFFQAHAIHSTRHAPPGSRGRDRYSTPPMPSIPGSGPCSPQPPPRTSSLDATKIFKAARMPSSPLSLNKASFQGQRMETTELEDEPVHVLDTTDAHRPALRSRKRSRLSTEDRASVEAPGMSTSSSFVEPLKRVAKKLRKMPTPIKDLRMSDNVFHLPPSPTTSTRGTSYLKEIAERMRSPSPAPIQVPAPAPAPAQAPREVMGRRVEPVEPELPRRSLSNSSRDAGRLRKRGKSSSLRSRASSAGSENWEVLGDPSSMEDEPDEADVFPLRSRELTALSIVPDVNRGIPMVPRIPDQYSYHKPRVYYHQDENMQATCFYGEAL
ncbi:hypothetical protein Daesc_003217 [Daldinia eschscholtzii]|uniref:Uncharacterized protein n=1 Tax=Daldinia eschscholtzii TaxID=292717 RepID=A0AAX6MT46_9PEZI